jgi:hypothetical protein
MREPLHVPDDVLLVLGRLASEPYQLRWIVHGTADEYVLASELINNVEAIARWAATATTMPRILAIIHKFLARYYECLESMPRDIDTQKDRAWLDLRAAAEQALQGLGQMIPDNLDG